MASVARALQRVVRRPRDGAGWYYVTSPGRMKVVHADGKSEIWEAKNGEAGWMGAEGPHSSENVGTTTMGFILVEVKSAATPAATRK